MNRIALGAAGLMLLAVVGCGTTAEESSVTFASGGAVTTSEPSPATEKPTTTTAAPTTTTTRATTTTTPPIGTQANPVPPGVPIPAGEWQITITGYEPDVSSLVVSFNQFNEPPRPGMVHARVAVDATFTGVGLGSPYELRMNLIGASKQTYQPISVSGGSGGDPAEIDNQAEAPTGGRVVGYVYFELTAADAVGPLLAFAPNVKYSDVPGGVGFFTVQ